MRLSPFGSFAILSNHFHLLLRNRPDLTAQWSDEEVMRRWWQLCPGRRDDQGRPAEITPTELQLNEIRTGLAESLETSQYTSAYQRILR